MLATLNTRQHLRARILDEPSAWNSIAIGTLKQTTAPPIQQETAGHSKMSVGNFNQFESADVSFPDLNSLQSLKSNFRTTERRRIFRGT
jgi:hypothetical protein